MELTILTHIPPEWQSRKPLEEYETTFLYTGFRRYNPKTKRLAQFSHEDGKILYSEIPWESGVLSRCYASEPARVIVYSTSPAAWAEVLTPTDVQFYHQAQQTV